MTILLIDKGDEQKVIEQERQKWLHSVLIALGAAAEFVTQDNKEYLDRLSISIWQNTDGEIDILRNNKIVAQWKAPKYLLVKENGKFYYKITLNEWALPFQKK